MNLENKISDWRKQMLAAGIKAPVPLDELEIHLREEIDRQMKSGSNEQRAFETAVQQIGQVRPLKKEFNKVNAENWNCPLALTAWVLFVVSFFLPANQYVGMGWKCACMSAHGFVDPEFWRGNLGGSLISGDSHLTLLTLANLLMIGSPFLFARFAHKAAFRKWFGLSTFAALVLVWSFIVQLLTHADGSELRIGCFVWGSSFLLLCLSALKARNRKSQTAAN